MKQNKKNKKKKKLMEECSGSNGWEEPWERSWRRLGVGGRVEAIHCLLDLSSL